MKKAIWLIVFAAIVAALSFGASQSESAGTDISPVTLKVYSDRGWFAPWEGPAAERITEKTGVNIKITKPLKDDATGEGIILMIASNDFPDILVVDWNNPGTPQLEEGGYLWDINELLDTYNPEFKAFINKTIGPELLAAYAAPDGKTYRIGFGGFVASKDSEELANVGFSIPCWVPAFVVRQDYFEEIGSPVIENAEDFLAALRAMSANHPDKFAILGDKNTKANWFTYHFGTSHTWGNYYADEATRELKYYTSSPAFEEAIKFMNLLAREELYPKEALVWQQEVQQEWVAGNVIVHMSNNCHGGDPIGETGTVIETLPPWDTYSYSLWRTPWMADLFPKSSKNVERAIEFVRYFASPEGYIDRSVGIEGDAWTGDFVNGPHFQFRPDIYTNASFPQGVPIWFDELEELWIKDPANRVKVGLDLPPIITFDGVAPGGRTWDGPSQKNLDFIEMLNPYFKSGPELYVPIRGDSEIGIIRQKINTLFDDYFARMVFADSEAEAVALIAEFQDKAKQAGLDQLETELTRVYRANLAKLGQ
jgi:ABC-type glycerol-3-phosphate transport system substrate-binding protein